jgi:hypothetical protein
MLDGGEIAFDYGETSFASQRSRWRIELDASTAPTSVARHLEKLTASTSNVAESVVIITRFRYPIEAAFK